MKYQSSGDKISRSGHSKVHGGLLQKKLLYNTHVTLYPGGENSGKCHIQHGSCYDGVKVSCDLCSGNAPGRPSPIPTSSTVRGRQTSHPVAKVAAQDINKTQDKTTAPNGSLGNLLGVGCSGENPLRKLSKKFVFGQASDSTAPVEWQAHQELSRKLKYLPRGAQRGSFAERYDLGEVLGAGGFAEVFAGGVNIISLLSTPVGDDV